MKKPNRTMFVRILAGAIAFFLVFLMLVGSLTSKAEVSPSQVLSKTYTFQLRNDENSSGHILSNPTVPAFWEYPELKAGQEKKGSFTVKNETTNPALITLNEIVLPYNDETALKYLQRVNVIITHNNKVLYDGNYAALASFDLKKIVDFNFVPNEEKKFDVLLKCDFSYDGDPLQETSHISWLYTAKDLGEDPIIDEPKDTFKTDILFFAGSILGIGIIVGTLLRITDKRKTKK